MIGEEIVVVMLISYITENTDNRGGEGLPTENPTSAGTTAKQGGDEEYDDDDGDASLTYFNFTHVLNPDDPLFEDEQQVCRAPVRCTSPDKRIIC